MNKNEIFRGGSKWSSEFGENNPKPLNLPIFLVIFFHPRAIFGHPKDGPGMEKDGPGMKKDVKKITKKMTKFRV